MSDNRNSSWVTKVISGGRVRRRTAAVGWPFWIPVFFTAIPFTVLFGVWAMRTTHGQLTLWQWMLAVPIGLTPAMILGLIVQTVWGVGIAVRENRFDLFDAIFAVFLLILCAGVGFLYWTSEGWFEVVMRAYVLLIIFPMVSLYARMRERSRRMRA